MHLTCTYIHEVWITSCPSLISPLLPTAGKKLDSLHQCPNSIFGLFHLYPLPRPGPLPRLPVYNCRTSPGSFMHVVITYSHLFNILFTGFWRAVSASLRLAMEMPVRNHWMCLSLVYHYSLDCTHSTLFTGFLSQVIHHSENTYRLQSLDRLYRTISIWRKNRSSISFDWRVPIISLVGRTFQRRRLPLLTTLALPASTLKVGRNKDYQMMRLHFKWQSLVNWSCMRLWKCCGL